jgi:class 3 adenylate cyclase
MTTKAKTTADFQRRQVAVLSFDAVGYCSGMARDEDETLSRFMAYLDIINDTVARYGGRTFGAAGDSIMAEFARAVDAVQCAVAVQKTTGEANAKLLAEQRLPFRIGIDVGDAIDQDGKLYGDGVNIAARLQERADPGGIIISEAVHAHVHALLDFSLEPLGDLVLKNIRHVVSAYRVRIGEGSEPDFASEVATAIDVSVPVPGFEGRPAIAVLPLTLVGDAAELEYVADGLADDLIQGLSAARSFPVIDRNSSFALRGAALGANRIGRVLGARYLASGSFRVTAAGDVRITVSLIDAESGRLLWSEPYNRPRDQLTAVPVDLQNRIIATLDATLNITEQRRYCSRPVADLDAWGLINRGKWHQNRFTREDATEARRLFDRALEREPDSVEALIQLAWWHFWNVWTQRGDAAGVRELARLATQALQIDNEDARGHLLVGISRVLVGDPAGALGPLGEAIRLNPSLSQAHATTGSAYILNGQPGKGIAPLLAGMRLSPRDLYVFHGAGELAVAYLMLEEWDKALEWCEKSLRLRPGYWYARVIAVCALARSGREGQAEAALSELLTRCPSFSQNHVLWLPFADKRWNAFLVEGLRLAGFTPDGQQVSVADA